MMALEGTRHRSIPGFNGRIAQHAKDRGLRVSSRGAEFDGGRFDSEVVAEAASVDVHRLGVPCGRTGKKRDSRRPRRDAEELTILMR